MAEKSWYRMRLTSDQIAQGAIWQIQAAFTEIYLANGAPKDVALLISESPNHIADPNNTSLYFTPLAARLCVDLIRSCGGATPCAEPSPLESSHLAGGMAYLSADREQRASQGESENN